MRYNLVFILLILATLRPQPISPSITLAWYSPNAVQITWSGSGWGCLQRIHNGIPVTLVCDDWGSGSHSLVWSWGPVETLTRFVPGNTVRIVDRNGVLLGESTPLAWPFVRWMPEVWR